MCDCRWKRVKKHPVGAGWTYTGDLLVEKCPYHLWYGKLSLADARLVSAMERRGTPRELHRDLLRRQTNRN